MSIEKKASSCSSPFLALFAAGFLCAVSSMAQDPGECANASSPGTPVPLTLDSSFVTSQGTDEWNSEVIKITVHEPGLLAVSAVGPEVQGLLYFPGSTGGDPVLLGERGIGTAGQTLAMVVEPGELCLRIVPPAGASGSVLVRTELIELISSPE